MNLLRQYRFICVFYESFFLKQSNFFFLGNERGKEKQIYAGKYLLQ